MTDLPHPIFNDSLDRDPARLSWQGAAQLVALCLLSLVLALTVVIATGLRLVYNLPSALLQRAGWRLSPG